MSNAAQVYARTAQVTASPRDIEAQALLKAAKQLQEAVTNWGNGNSEFSTALLFNRKLWSIFLSAAVSNDNPQPQDVRQKIANIGIFVMSRTAELQVNPDRDKVQSLIDINRNLAAGLAGRA
jgi:flagellar protein FlaF